MAITVAYILAHWTEYSSLILVKNNGHQIARFKVQTNGTHLLYLAKLFVDVPLNLRLQVIET